MIGISEKQLIRLKYYAKNKELSSGILKGIDFKKLSKEDADALIDKCFNKLGAGYGSDPDSLCQEDSEFSPEFSKVYKGRDNSQYSVGLTKDEVQKIRDSHYCYCLRILGKLEEMFPEEREIHCIMFSKVADKVFTWFQSALDEKVRKKMRRPMEK